MMRGDPDNGAKAQSTDPTQLIMARILDKVIATISDEDCALTQGKYGSLDEVVEKKEEIARELRRLAAKGGYRGSGNGREMLRIREALVLNMTKLRRHINAIGEIRDVLSRKCREDDEVGVYAKGVGKKR